MTSTLEQPAHPKPSMASRIVAFAIVATIAVLGAIWLQENVISPKPTEETLAEAEPTEPKIDTAMAETAKVTPEKETFAQTENKAPASTQQEEKPLFQAVTERLTNPFQTTQKETIATSGTLVAEEVKPLPLPTVQPAPLQQTEQKLKTVRDVLKTEITKRRAAEKEAQTKTTQLKEAQNRIILLTKALEKQQTLTKVEPAAGPSTIIHVHEAYETGENPAPYLKSAYQWADQTQNTQLRNALNQVEQTHGNQPVTQLQILNFIQHMLAQGAPVTTQNTEDTAWEKSVGNLLTIRKAVKNANDTSWREDMYQLQNLIAANRIGEARTWLENTYSLKQDNRLSPLAGMLTSYHGQLAAWQKVRQATYR